MTKTSSPSSPPFFKGVHAYFLGLSPTFTKPATKALHDRGGNVISLLHKAATTSASKQLPAEVTHVLCSDTYKNASPAYILKALGVGGPLPPLVKVVRAPWISECIQKKQCVSTAPFEIDMNASPTLGSVLDKHPANQQQGASRSNGKRPRPHPSSNPFADDSLPPAQPLLQGRTPKRLSYPFISPTQHWLMYDVGLLHLRPSSSFCDNPRVIAILPYHLPLLRGRCASPLLTWTRR